MKKFYFILAAIAVAAVCLTTIAILDLHNQADRSQQMGHYRDSVNVQKIDLDSLLDSDADLDSIVDLIDRSEQD